MKLGRPKTKEFRVYMSLLVNPYKKKDAVKLCKENNTTLPDEMSKFFDMIKDKWWLLLIIITIGLFFAGGKVVEYAKERATRIFVTPCFMEYVEECQE